MILFINLGLFFWIFCIYGFGFWGVGYVSYEFNLCIICEGLYILGHK